MLAGGDGAERLVACSRSALAALVDDADALAGALAEGERLRAALAWYADELHYDRLVGDPARAPSPVIADGGAIARAALGGPTGTAGPGRRIGDGANSARAGPCRGNASLARRNARRGPETPEIDQYGECESATFESNV